MTLTKLIRVLLAVMIAVLSVSAQDGWQYDSYQEGVDRKQVSVARLMSTNAVKLDFPYDFKPVRAKLTIARRNRMFDKITVSIAITDGQIQCPALSSTCVLDIKLDENKKNRVFVKESDTTSRTVFVVTPDDFLRRIKKATALLVEVPIRNKGNIVFEFDVSNLDVKKLEDALGN